MRLVQVLVTKHQKFEKTGAYLVGVVTNGGQVKGRVFCVLLLFSFACRGQALHGETTY